MHFLHLRLVLWSDLQSEKYCSLFRVSDKLAMFAVNHPQLMYVHLTLYMGLRICHFDKLIYLAILGLIKSNTFFFIFILLLGPTKEDIIS